LREFRFTEVGGVEYLVWQEHPALDRLIMERAMAALYTAQGCRNTP